jgi:amino acid adenylation domain-containing protein
VRYPGGPALTYRELDRRANRMANALRAHGVGREDVVGICLPRSVDFVVAVLASVKAGAAFLPLDPDSPPDRVAGLLADARPAALVTDRAAAPPGVTRLTPADAATHADTDPGVAIDPDQLAYLIYTSGSTGRPKAVAVTHRALVRKYRSWETAYGLDAHPGTHLQAAAVAFDVCVGDLVRALLSGGRLVLCPPDAVPDPAALLDVIRHEGVDTVELLPSVLNLLAAHLTETGQRLTTLRLVAIGGEAWTGTDLRRYRAVLGDDTRLLNVYGVTEATIGNTFLDLPAGTDTGDPLPVGYPLPDVTAVVLDPAGRPTPPGAIGEIFLGGVGLARGYHGRPDLTAQRFVPDPVVPGARLYRTGDRARCRVDGSIEFLGRSDAQVKIRGFRVEPGEVEAALLALPGVREAAVLAVADPAGARLAAYVSGPSSTVDIRNLLRDRLPGHLVPSSVQVLPALPRTGSGKVDRRALPAPVAAGPGSARSRPPAPGLEAQVAAVWREILAADAVTADDDFFDLGGHSLLAARVTARLTAVCGVRIAVRELLAVPTVAGVAARIAELLATTTERAGPALVPRARRAHLVDAGAFDDTAATS